MFDINKSPPTIETLMRARHRRLRLFLFALFATFVLAIAFGVSVGRGFPFWLTTAFGLTGLLAFVSSGPCYAVCLSGPNLTVASVGRITEVSAAAVKFPAVAAYINRLPEDRGLLCVEADMLMDHVDGLLREEAMRRARATAAAPTAVRIHSDRTE